MAAWLIRKLRLKEVNCPSSHRDEGLVPAWNSVFCLWSPSDFLVRARTCPALPSSPAHHHSESRDAADWKGHPSSPALESPLSPWPSVQTTCLALSFIMKYHVCSRVSFSNRISSASGQTACLWDLNLSVFQPRGVYALLIHWLMRQLNDGNNLTFHEYREVCGSQQPKVALNTPRAFKYGIDSRIKMLILLLYAQLKK